MSEYEKILTLTTMLQKHLAVANHLHDYYQEYLRTEFAPEQKKRSDAIVIADTMVNYYTCLETIFLRISQFFENDLRKERWHQDLLEKMTLHIEGIRPAAIQDATFKLLAELLKFRHFKRYYFELDYDWDKLEFLQKKFVHAHPLIQQDLQAFLAFLNAFES
jgi:D-alanyl-lipoteichoic acid acyltransferase DltB (MBOAT superfamily)